MYKISLEDQKLLEQVVTCSKNRFLAFCRKSFAILRISGQDATRYLQGRITQDLSKATKSSETESPCSLPSLILSPEGRVQGSFFLIKDKNSFFVLSPFSLTSDHLNRFIEQLLCYQVADDIIVEPDPSFNLMISIYSKSALDRETLPETLLPHSLLSRALLVVDESTVCPGWHIIVPATSAQDLENLKTSLESSSFQFLPESIFEHWQTYRGIPLWGREITEKTLVPDLPLSLFVSFTKGCYVGQEVVEMARSRGRANRRLVRLIFDSAIEIPSNSSLYVDKSSSAICGTVTSSVMFPGLNRTFALAYIRTSQSLESLVFFKEHPGIQHLLEKNT